MSHLDLYAGCRSTGFNGGPMYKVVQPTQVISEEEYMKLVRNLQTYSGSPQLESTDKSSYESSSSGVSSDSGESSYDNGDRKYQKCQCTHASEHRYKTHNSRCVAATRKPPTPPKPCYFTPAQVTNVGYYSAPNIVATAQPMQAAVYNANCVANQSYNEYVCDLLQYQNQWINSYVANEAGFYMTEPVYSHQTLQIACGNPTDSPQPQQYHDSNPKQENERSQEYKRDDLNKHHLQSPIKDQIERFEYLLSKIKNGSGENRTSKQQRTPPHKPNQMANHAINRPVKTTRNTKSDGSKLLQKARKTFLGLYEVLSMIGVGGGGVVYAGTEISSQKPVAIKRIMREKIKRWGLVGDRKVPQEIALMIKVNGHNNVIKLINWYECLDSYVMIMERPNNSIDLFDYIRAVGRITEEEGAFIFRQVVEAVKHVEERGVLHRDVKDENVIIDNQTKKVKLIDFGCGTLLHNRAYTDFSGTPEFYPPEWYTKKQYIGRTASVWSLGVLLYDMLCGEIPFKTKSKIVANKLVYKVYLSEPSKQLIKWMLTSDERLRPTLSQIINHPWIQRHTG